MSTDEPNADRPKSGNPARPRRNPSEQRALQAELRELADVVGPGPLVDLLLERAFQMQATDIHLDPTGNDLRVRVRVDGLLHDILRLPSDTQNQVISRVKLLGGMDITERRHAQDGHISNSIAGVERDVRIGSGPTIHGERLVLRLMPESGNFTRLEELGIRQAQQELLERQLNRPYGMILAVGPVGSGKTTTMYAGLHGLNEPHRSLVTIEDPVERRIEGVNQIQVDNRTSFGFAEALRACLRQDPNVMMVGEIRDAETAHIAGRAALTGVLVLSTMHANDAASAVDVLREFDVPPAVIADSVNCIVSQRLLRRASERSREEYSADDATAEILGLSAEERADATLVRGIPSEENFQTGYVGRTGVYEVMPIDGDVRKAILRGAPTREIRDIARANGMSSLESEARAKALSGETTVEEFVRLQAGLSDDPTGKRDRTHGEFAGNPDRRPDGPPQGGGDGRSNPPKSSTVRVA
ncbi:GspE/PulE family protein [Alienimonas californiensis]|uniref:Type II secretion system protein E n=1 Tax=Alienimonas californiensis TaxID=2527989 RepID=A0A517PC22_9PLAN|nr:GspE/PulE family protein [Alienimonas californiensis]QDT16901.1 Type II secretion system protein E [Alienimonas californiensis]